MKVIFATDVELWPRDWDLSRAEMRRAFRQFILGATPSGQYGLPFQLRLLGDHGLHGVFFVEPLFASVMGRGALEETVGMIRDAGQEIQLHVHTEWLGRSPALEAFGQPVMSIKDLPSTEQSAVIALAREWIEDAGAPRSTVFRAGAFGASRETLRVLEGLGILIDSSHNPAGARGPLDPHWNDVPRSVDGVVEVPQTVFRDGVGCQRNLQLTSTSTGEMEWLLADARRKGRQTVVVLSHSAELLNADRQRPDPVAIRRFEALCGLLADSNSETESGTFSGVADEQASAAIEQLSTPMTKTGWRYLEQAWRRRY